LLRIEEGNNRLFNENLPAFPTFSAQNVQAISGSSSGTALPYISEVSRLFYPGFLDASDCPQWAKDVTVTMDTHSKAVSQRGYLHERLDKINRDLGARFNVALTTYAKCQNGIVNVDLPAIQFRDVLQQIWGGLVNMARIKNEEVRNSGMRFELRGEKDRALVADLLANNSVPKIKLLELLDDMNSLHYSLSDTRFGKNPLNKDFSTLKTYYNQWLSIVDAVSSLVV
jgi:hypothetical protein